MTETLRVYRRSELELIADGCFHRFHKLWVEMLDDASDLSMIGIAGHAISFAYVMRLVEKRIPQDAEEAQAAFIEGIAAARTPSRLIPEVKKVWDFHAEHFELPLEKFVTAEEKQVSGISNKAALGFTPDLVLAHPERNELEIVDQKWGWNPPMSEDALRMLFQARVYSRYGMERWPGFASYRFTINAVRFGKFVSVVFTRLELDSVDVEVAAAVATIHRCEETGSWPAVPGPSCVYCELDCPAMKQAGDLPKRLTVVEQAQTVAGWLLANDAQSRAGKKALKAYVAGHGPVEVNGMVYDNRETIERKYPLDEVIKVLAPPRAVGAFEDKPYLTVSHSSLAKVFKEYPDLETALAGVLQEKSGWRFTAKRAGADEGSDEAED